MQQKTRILQEIVTCKRLEVADQKRVTTPRKLQAMSKEALEQPVRSMCTALKESSTGIIAEFKRKSPSKGWLFAGARVEDIVPAYEKAGAAACSILTDHRFFGGSPDDLQRVRKSVKLPLLRKDFILDEYQLYQTRVMGADAVLLIAAALTEDECFSLAGTAHSLGLEVLLEIHHEDELRYLNPYIDILGVNNRDLETFHTDVSASFRLIKQISGRFRGGSIISESGISGTEVVKELRRCGFNGFLIGETFMRTQNPGKSLGEFIKGVS